MATPAHARMACPDQKNPDSVEQEGGEGLKNGTTLEDSDDSSSNMLVKNRSPANNNQQHRDMAMDGFQDGGSANSRSANVEGGFPASADSRSRLDYSQFNQSTRIEGNNEDFRNSQEQNYNHGGDMSSYGGGRFDQHGGGQSSEMTNSQSNKIYSQYNQPQVRPGYPRGPQRSAVGGNYGAQQRFLSGPALSQQTAGPTPTLNQLLQAPNSLQRYHHNNYEYSVGHKNMDPPYQGPNSSWGNMRSAGYPQQMYRNQGGGPPPMPESSSVKRPYNSHSAAPQGQYPPQQYHPPYGQQGGSAVRHPPATPQQGGQQQYSGLPQQGSSQSSQMSPAGGYEQQRQQQLGSYGGPPPSQTSQPPPTQPAQHPPSSSQPPSSLQQSPSSQPPPHPHPLQQQSQSLPPQISQQSSQELSGSEELTPEQGSGSTTPGLRNLTTPPHPVVSPHRPPPPSPSGSSAGSPSMSPALGQQPNIPMPPRPSSTQSENSGGPPPQSPAASQGFNQQMVCGSKMHPGMVGSSSSHMTPSAHYSQGGYHRPPSSSGMHNYSGQPQSNYPGPSYPAQPPIPTHRMPSSTSSVYGSPSNSGGYSNSQYPAAAVSAPPAATPTGYGMNSMMPPPNQYPKTSSMPPPPTGGAQAAAQAAVIAAAASSGSRQSPMYLRQHLQQKIYNSYSSAISPVPPGSNDCPMPPPVCTPSSHINQPSASLGSCEGPVSMVPAGFTQTSAPSTIAVSATTVTQSISSPVPSAVTVSSPSVPDMMQSRNSMGGGPLPPPPVMDEGSQASNASASSSLPEERVETPKPNNKPVMSHPPTPNTLPSPGAASMSSFHDEFESVSSPSWPRTPASPVINNQVFDHHPIKRPDGMLKLYDMSEDPDRGLFLDKLIMYQEERGTPLSQCPTISKQPLDLYRLYLAAKERGGFVEVMKGKMWKEIAGLIGIGASSSAAYTLRKQYIKHLLPYECKFDRGGIDPVPLISSLESNSRKKNAKNAAGGSMMDGYPSPYSGGYPPTTGSHPGMMPGSDYPGHHPPYQEAMHHSNVVNHHGGTEGAAMDPFSDDMQSSQYQQRHSTGEGYGYSQPNAANPSYSGNQPSPSSFSYSGNTGQQEQFGDQYSNSMVPPIPETSYPNRNIVSDPYAPPGGYPPNRTVGPQYPNYQESCTDQERFVETQPTPSSPMVRPPTAAPTSVIGPSPPSDSSPYPPHRYPGQPMGARDSMPPQQPMGYQGRPSQYPNSQPSSQSPYPSVQPDSYRGSEFQPQMSRLQSTLIQRLLPKNQPAQNYPGSQQGMYGQSMPPPNKVAPPSSIPGNLYQRDMYTMGPKRHTDYAKSHSPGQDPPYHVVQDRINTIYPQSQTPYSDRGQYVYRPSHGVPPQAPGPPQQGWPRDNRPYSSNQNHYSPAQRDNWERHGENASQPRVWARYSGPQNEAYPHHMSPSMGPKMMPRGFPSNKMQQPGPQYSVQRKEVIFPPDAVEAVSPLITKRRRVLSKDIAPTDAWRIMMALKSGLLGESTWALDVLAILVHDDATVLYFGLNHLQGLLEVLMDHYRRCLNLIFDLVGDMEVGFMLNPGECVNRDHKTKWYELDCDLPESTEPKESPSDRLSDERTSILDTVNYTYRTRCKKVVRTQEEEALFLFDPDKKWDVHEGFISGSSHWQHGGGEYTGYIQTHFENSEKRVRFVRILKNKSNVSKTDSELKLSKSQDERLGGSVNSKKEFGSDTEEDESLSVNSPKSLKSDKCANEKTLPHSDDTIQLHITFEKDEQLDNKELVKNNVLSEMCDKIEVEKANEILGSNFPKIRMPTRKRKSVEDLEDESYNRDEPSLSTIGDSQDSLMRRCICVSSILRNLSFVPGNDTEMSKHAGFLLVLGRLLLLHHIHSTRKPPQRHYDREEEGENSSVADSCSSLNSEHEWWWDMLHIIRENTLVTIANIAGQLDLAPFPEEISFPILDGLMHWVTCPSSYAQDPLPTQPSHSVLSPQRLSLEALSKLSVLESNVDLMMATPPWERIDRFFNLLSKWLSRNEDQVLREFSVVLLSNLSQADSSMARAIALQGTCIPLLITFVEQAEQSALQVANAQGINALRENPELMGTTLDMVRRAAGTLRCLAKVPANRTLFLQHQQRLLALVMSQILDQGVASIIADVLFECSQEDSEDLPSLTNGEKVSSPSTGDGAT